MTLPRLPAAPAEAPAAPAEAPDARPASGLRLTADARPDSEPWSHYSGQSAPCVETAPSGIDRTRRICRPTK